ncbi:MAG: hypothetical protein Q9227_008721 [Pyrenula ochraceoflavens]
MAASLDVEAVRSHFPALSRTKQVYFDNAGGSQILGSVVESISDYLLNNNVQLGASYKVAQISTQKYNEGVAAAAKYVGAREDEVAGPRLTLPLPVFGSSTTQLFRNLSNSLAPHIPPGPSSEIVLSPLDHEANLSSWLALAKSLSLTVKWWPPEFLPTTSSSSSSPPPPSTSAKIINPHLTVPSLLKVLTPATKLVACTHTSNILGTITDIRSIAHAVHTTHPSARTLLCIDAVAYAPHRPIPPLSNPSEGYISSPDFYAFSFYKLYGPHCALLYASRPAQDSRMASLGHYFKTGQSLEDKLALAGASYELVASIPAVTAYLPSSAAAASSSGLSWDAIAAHESHLSSILLSYLLARKDVTLYGSPSSAPEVRVPVISFRVAGWRSADVIYGIEGAGGSGGKDGEVGGSEGKDVEGSRYGARSGHFYSRRLCERVIGGEEGGGDDAEVEDGVVRVSLCHYNTGDPKGQWVRSAKAVVWTPELTIW